MKRRICNYANASNKPAFKDAMYQRGQFYIKETSKQRGDRRRYAVYMNDDLLGLGGSLARVKRFVNTLYKKYPFAVTIDDDMVKVIRRAGKVAQMDMRPDFKDTIASMLEQIDAASKRRKAQSRKNGTPGAEKSTAAKPKAKAKVKKLTKLTATRWKKFKTDSERARMKADKSDLLKINRELSEYASTGVPKISKLLAENRQAIEFINQQGRLF